MWNPKLSAMKIKVTFRDSGIEAYLNIIPIDIDNDVYDWEYVEDKLKASYFEDLTRACKFCAKFVSDVPDSFFASDNEISKIEFVE